MKHAVIIEAELIDKKTLKLTEPLENIHGTLELIIKTKRKTQTPKKLIGFFKDKIHINNDFDKPLDDFRKRYRYLTMTKQYFKKF